MQGNFGAITGIHRRFKEVLIKYMGGEDTPAARKELVDTESEQLKAMFNVPEEIKSHIHEGFEPLLVSEEVIDNHFVRIIDLILDFDSANSTDANFIEEMKDALSFLIGEWIEELEDGFHNGMQDVVIFFRENLKRVVEQAVGPEMGMMVAMMGTDSIMKFITKSYSHYKEKKAQLRAAAKERDEKKKSTQAAQGQPREDVAMADAQEEEKEVSAETRKERFLAKWGKVIE